MKQGIAFDLKRMIAKGCCCNNCKRHFIGDYDDENKCGSFVRKQQHLCKRKIMYYKGVTLIDKDVNKFCCKHWKEL